MLVSTGEEEPDDEVDTLVPGPPQAATTMDATSTTATAAARGRNELFSTTALSKEVGDFTK
jgi:hypothetical protein